MSDIFRNDLEPGGLWRCNACGGLVEEFGCYVCTACAFTNVEVEK
jgi:ABC-type ATPase with predicted acetyltransferase domain